MSEKTSILQEWVIALGLRHQGTLLSAIRGCDNIGKEDPSKAVMRALRGVFLRPFGPNPASFIDIRVTEDILQARFVAFLRDFDHLPVHFVLHLASAAEIVGYKHPAPGVRKTWKLFYYELVHKFHLRPETETRLDKRLNACEADFHAQQ